MYLYHSSLQPSILSQLRTIVTKIVASPQRRRRFRRTAEATYKEEVAATGTLKAKLMVIRDVITRWNYTHAMITRALSLRDVSTIPHSRRALNYNFQAIDKWVFDLPELRPLLLQGDQWTLIKQIGELLEVLYFFNSVFVASYPRV